MDTAPGEWCSNKPVPHLLVRIVAPWFVAGLVFENGRATEAAPIIGYMKGLNRKQVAKYVEKRGWSVHPIKRRRDAWVELETEERVG